MRHAGPAALEPSHRIDRLPHSGTAWQAGGSPRSRVRVGAGHATTVSWCTRAGAERARHHGRRRHSRSRPSSARSSTLPRSAAALRSTSRSTARSAATHDARLSWPRCFGVWDVVDVKGTPPPPRTARRPRRQLAPSESEREHMLLRVLREHGLPEPERQYSIHDDAGNFVARPDLVYRDLKDRDGVRQLPATCRQGGARPRQSSPQCHRRRSVGLIVGRDRRGRPVRKRRAVRASTSSTPRASRTGVN